MTTLDLPKITPRTRLWTVEEYHRMAYPEVFGPDERLELIEGEIFFRGTDVLRPFTLSEYQKLHDMGLLLSGDQIALVNGKGVPAMSPMGRPHAVSVVKTEDALESGFGSGYVVWSQSPADFSEWSEPEPDVFVTRGAADDYMDFPPGPQDAILVVEISDTSLRQDRGRKACLYAAAGVNEYWIVNLTERVLEVHRDPQDGEYLSRSVFGEAETVLPLAAPNAPVPVASLLPLKRA